MIPFSPPHIDEDTIQSVSETLRSGWITTGPKTKLFEKQLSAYCGCSDVLCLSSATAGLEIMLRWFGVKQGDEVIVPAYTYSATANVIVHCGATPILADCGDGFNIDPIDIENKITSRTKVIMPVDFAGMPCDYERINRITQLKKTIFIPEGDMQKKLGRILVLSDSAHSFGAILNQKKTGSLTDISVFSFHAVKNLTTAEGGAICFNLPEPFNNKSVYDELCIKTLHGQNKDALAKTKPGNWRYDIVEAGYKMNMTDIQAAIGIVQLAKYDFFILKRRKEIVKQFNTFFSQYSWALIPEHMNPHAESSYHLYALRIKGISESQRDQVIQLMFESGVSVNVHFIPLPMHSFYKNLGYSMNDYPKAFEHYQHEISLPLYPDLSDSQVETICESLSNAVNKILAS